MTLYSSSFTLKPRYAVNVEYSIPRECGNLISRKRLMVVGPFASRSPSPTESVAHSPTASAVIIAARRGGAVRNAAGACALAGAANKSLRTATPNCDAINPHTRPLSASDVFIGAVNHA